MKIDRHHLVSNFYDILEYKTVPDALVETTVKLFEQIFCCGLDDVHNMKKGGTARKEKARKKEVAIILDQMFYIIDFTLRSSKPYGHSEALAFSQVADDARKRLEIIVFDLIECIYQFRKSKLSSASPK